MISEGKIAIIVVGYNRPDSMRRVLNSLDRANYQYYDIPLIISIDHSENKEVIQAANEFKWMYGNKEVIYRRERMGLRKHIIACGDLSEKYGAVMILEDDLYVSPDFYNYAMQALEKYGDHPKIAGIGLNTRRELLESAYPFYTIRSGDDIYFQQFATSWGQVWNYRMWNGFKVWYEQNQELPYNSNVPEVVLNYPPSSWAKYFQSYVVTTDKYFVYSYDSLTTNFGDAGQHFVAGSSSQQVNLFYGSRKYRMPEFEAGVKYDIYGEPVGLGVYLGIDDKQLTCDMWGRKQENSYKQYLLTCKKYPYKILKSFSMSMKPMELNIICDILGDGIFLYDTTQKDSMSNGDNRYHYLEYSYGFINGRDLMLWTINRIKRKLCK